MRLDIIVLNKYSLYEEIYYDVSKLSFNPREVVDENILNNYKCLCCEYEFSN